MSNYMENMMNKENAKNIKNKEKTKTQNENIKPWEKFIVSKIFSQL